MTLLWWIRYGGGGGGGGGINLHMVVLIMRWWLWRWNGTCLDIQSGNYGASTVDLVVLQDINQQQDKHFQLQQIS